MKYVATVFALLASVSAHAVTIDFDLADYDSYDGTTAEIDGYTFVSTGGFSPELMRNPISGNYALLYCPDCTLNIQQSDSSGFSLTSLDFSAGSGFFGDITVTGFLAEGGTISTTLSAPGVPALSTYSFDANWGNLVALELSPFISGQSVGYAIDNLVVGAAVPVPAAAWLFASGFGLLGWFGRRRLN